MKRIRKTDPVSNIAILGAGLSMLLVAFVVVVAELEWEFGHRLFSHLCHQKADRCFAIGGTHMAICSRCLGVYSGIAIGSILFWLRPNIWKEAGIWAWLVLAGGISANLLDFGLEWFGIYGNEIWLRLGFGLYLGLAIALFVLTRAGKASGE